MPWLWFIIAMETANSGKGKQLGGNEMRAFKSLSLESHVCASLTDQLSSC